MSGKEFPNNWEEIKDADDDMFETCTFDEFMTGMSMWQLPSSHAFIMRVYNSDTKKVTEHTYRKAGNARNKLMKLVEDPSNEIVLADNYSIHLIKQGDEYSDE